MRSRWKIRWVGSWCVVNRVQGVMGGAQVREARTSWATRGKLCKFISYYLAIGSFTIEPPLTTLVETIHSPRALYASVTPTRTRFWTWQGTSVLQRCYVHDSTYCGNPEQRHPASGEREGSGGARKIKGSPPDIVRLFGVVVEYSRSNAWPDGARISCEIPDILSIYLQESSLTLAWQTKEISTPGRTSEE
jgi:hypothetical protein